MRLSQIQEGDTQPRGTIWWQKIAEINSAEFCSVLQNCDDCFTAIRQVAARGGSSHNDMSGGQYQYHRLLYIAAVGCSNCTGKLLMCLSVDGIILVLAVCSNDLL